MRGETVVLAAGNFPKKGGAAWKLLAEATRVVACDSAAIGYRRRFRRWPDVIVGDLDSLGPSRVSRLVSCVTELIHCPDQDTNDLEKALLLCRQRGWKAPVVVGATGRREDHSLGNVFRALDYGVETVTDCGRFVPVCGKVAFAVRKGAAVSVFATDPKTRMTSKGLEWPLDGVCFRNLYCATLNLATSTRLVLTSTRPVYVYLTGVENDSCGKAG